MTTRNVEAAQVLAETQRGLPARVVIGTVRAVRWTVRAAFMIVLMTFHGPADFLLRLVTGVGLAAMIVWLGWATVLLNQDQSPENLEVAVIGAVVALIGTTLRLAYRGVVDWLSRY